MPFGANVERRERGPLYWVIIGVRLRSGAVIIRGVYTLFIEFLMVFPMVYIVDVNKFLQIVSRC